jgi:hypothetical protein
MRISPLDFSQARMAPEYVMRGLEQLDPSACIVHLGGPMWVVGKVRPNALVTRDAGEMLHHWTVSMRAGAKMSRTAKLRARFAQLALLGFRPVDQYEIVGEPDGRIVRAFAVSRYHWLHTSSNEVWQGMDDAEEAQKIAAKTDMMDDARHGDAWRYAFTKSHSMATTLTPTERPKTGWTRHGGQYGPVLHG